MEKAKEYQKELTKQWQAVEQAREAERQADGARDAAFEPIAATPFTQRREVAPELMRKYQAAQDYYIRCHKATERAQDAYRFAYNNYKILQALELAPVLVDILKKYDGKQAGTRTREKIIEEFKARTGWGGYFSHNYYFEAYPLTNDGYRRGGSDEQITLVYHKPGESLQELIDDLNTIHAPAALCALRLGEFVADIPARLDLLAHLKEQAENLQNQLEYIKKAYRAAWINGIEELR